MAAEFGQLEVVKLLKEYGADVNSVSKVSYFCPLNDKTITE